MRLLAIDYGTRRIGLAIGDATDKTVVPFGFIENKGNFFVIEEIKKVCEEEDIDKIIIGIPAHKEMESKQAELTKRFVKILKENISIKTDVFDESFTSKIADQDRRYKDLMKDRKKGWRDARAAEEILRGYLEKY